MADAGETGETPADTLRPLLYGDMPVDEFPVVDDANGEPWVSFVAARTALHAGAVDDAVAAWRRIAELPGAESRVTLQAWTFLRDHGVAPPADVATTVLGVVVEVPVDGGRDVLAAYRDGSARYLNHSGRVLVAEAGVESITAPVAEVIAAAEPLAAVVGVWDQPALPDLGPGDSRLLLLTPAGFRFGQGPDAQLRQDPSAAPLFDAATRLLVALVDLDGN
jgi:hypothetical protein